MASDTHFPDLSRIERGFHYFIVWQTVYQDNQRYTLPVLYLMIGSGEELKLVRSKSLLDYCVDNHIRSQTWLIETLRSVGMLIDFTHAWMPFLKSARSRNRPEASHKFMLRRFAKAIINGTSIIENGRRYDGVGLYWPPRSQQSAKTLLTRLTAFLVSLSNESGDWSLAAAPDENDPFAALRIAYRLTVQRKRSLLAHLPPARTVPAPSHPFDRMFTSKVDGARIYRFPAQHVWRLLFEGFNDETAELIAFILFAGGSRLSELFHLWVQDLQFLDNRPLLFLHHPREGVVYDRDGKRTNRVGFLQRQTRVPRNALKKRGHAGFKGLAGEFDGAELIWLPIPGLAEELASRLKHYITITRPRLMRLRRAKGLPDHNYLFVGSGRTFSNDTNPVGHPYTIEAFRSAWKKAIRRIASLYDDPELTVAKHKGTTPHGARHLYGTFLKTIGCDGAVIQRCMHHKSPFSHLVYTELTANEINSILRRQSKKAIVDFGGMFATVSEALQKQAGRFSGG